MKFLTQKHNQDLVIKQAYFISQKNLLARVYLSLEWIKIFERFLHISRQENGRVVVLHDIFLTPIEVKTAKKIILGQRSTDPNQM